MGLYRPIIFQNNADSAMVTIIGFSSKADTTTVVGVRNSIEQNRTSDAVVFEPWCLGVECHLGTYCSVAFTVWRLLWCYGQQRLAQPTTSCAPQQRSTKWLVLSFYGVYSSRAARHLRGYTISCVFVGPLEGLSMSWAVLKELACDSNLIVSNPDEVYKVETPCTTMTNN